MDFDPTASSYNRIAEWWRGLGESDYGIAELEEAAQACGLRSRAIDIGCGSQGRFIEQLTQWGFSTVEGLDISSEMIALAKERHPNAIFHTVDIREWTSPHHYNLIAAWDSLIHLPLNAHEPTLVKLLSHLAPGGVLLFTCDGSEEARCSDLSFAGESFQCSTIGLSRIEQITKANNCQLAHRKHNCTEATNTVVFAQRAAINPE